MTKYLFYFFMAFAVIACSRYPADVERALKLAGDNRAELEKVLEHYSKRPENALKLKSAYFLIANMPYHYAIHDARLESLKIHLQNNELQEDFLNNYKKTQPPVTGNREIKPDLYYITSEYLIRNIDFSFQVWQGTPWKDFFSFDDFCEDILPYRLGHEPLEYWKEAYYAAFRPIIDTMGYTGHPVEICKKLLKHIQKQGWIWENDTNTQGLGALLLLEKRLGNCEGQAEYLTYMLRSVGIPSGIDMVILNPDDYASQAHTWNYVRNMEEKNFFFDFYTDVDEIKNYRKNGKIYRQRYALQKESLPVKHKKHFIPPGGLRNVLLHDVTFEYIPETHISICSKHVKQDLLYLCVFNPKNAWIPVAWCKQREGAAKFRNVEPGILYQIRFIDETQDVAASQPFILHSNENAQFFDADTTDLQTMTLFRKYRWPIYWPDYIHRAVNGKFQGANQPDFSDAATLHTINKPADFNYELIQTEDNRKYKYVRYLSAREGYNNMAEVQFYSDGQLLHGKVIGTDSAKNDFPNSDKYSVFDNDPLTFFNAPEADGAWAGLEFDKAYTINAIRYIFRNDDNNIRSGDSYELLYINGKRWLSAGRQTADTTFLFYDKVPSNTLYWLHNHTRGKEERPFTYENGKQVWW